MVDPQGASFDDRCDVVIRIGVAAHRYGATSVRLQEYLVRVSHVLGLSGVFRSTPSEIVFAFASEHGAPQRIHLTATPPPKLYLDKLGRLGDLVHELEAERLDPTQIPERIEAIDERPQPFGTAATAVAYSAVGIGLAVILRGAVIDVVVATVLAAAVAAIVLVSPHVGERAKEWLPFTSACFASVTAVLVKLVIDDLNLLVVVLSAIAVLIPGYTISLGVAELVSGSIVPGATNLFNGLLILAEQFLGAWVGYSLMVAVIDLDADPGAVPVANSWQFFFTPVLIAGLATVFQTAPRDFFWVCSACLLAYLVYLGGREVADENVGTFLGAVAAVVFANIWTSRVRRPTSIVLLPAIVLLVSGSIGFRGLAEIAEGDVTAGQHEFLQMFVVALLVTAGLLVGDTLVRPRTNL